MGENEIKLFGQTIVLKVKQEEEQSCNHDNHDDQSSDDHDHDHDHDQSSEDKIKMRPNKKIPCPRCKSMETKFCYFNNYNVNQPRHFCKGCQRYWTAGGALRNVPIGAGRRKNKPPGRNGGLFSDNGCLIEGMMNDIDEWQVAAFSHGFQVKRRRSESNAGQTC